MAELVARLRRELQASLWDKPWSYEPEPGHGYWEAGDY